MLTNAQLEFLNLLDKLERPPVEWDALAGEVKDNGNLRAVVRDLESLSERAARLARYLDARDGNGCGDQGHGTAVKAQNRVGRVVHEKAFGYNATHDITF